MSLRTGFSLLRESWYVLKVDSELMWFPVMSGIAAMRAGFLLPPGGEWTPQTLDGWVNEDVAFSRSQ